MRESLSGETRERNGPKRVWILLSADVMNASQLLYACCRWSGDRLTSLFLVLDDLSDLTLQPLLQLLMPVPHPPLEMRPLETSVSQPKLVKDFRLVFEALSRLLVHRIFE